MEALRTGDRDEQQALLSATCVHHAQRESTRESTKKYKTTRDATKMASNNERVAGITNPEWAGKDFDPSDPNQTTAQRLNTYIVDCLEQCG